MNNHYLSLILLIFVPLAAMEQGALPPQPTQRSISSLKEIALKAYAKILCENAPEAALSEKELVGWGESMGLSVFYDEDLGSLLPRLEQILAEPTVIKTDLKCPKIFSSDGCSGFFDDWDREKQYIVHTDEQRSVDSITSMGVRFECDSGHYGQWPTFSPDAGWMVGWEEKKRATLMLMPRVLNFDFAEICLVDDETDYTFFDADTILVRTFRAISMSSIADVVSKGAEALKMVYCRDDRQEYPSPLFFRTIHALSNSHIACVGPDEKSIEILKCGADGLFSLAKIVKIPNISIGRLVVHNVRGIAALRLGYACTTVCLYQLLGDEAGEKSTLTVKCLENYVFSPSGEYLACGTNLKRQVIEIFDCKNLASPQRIQVIPRVVEMGAAKCMIWTDERLIVSDGWGKKHIITFNKAAPFVARYAAYRKKLEEKEKETNKNAS